MALKKYPKKKLLKHMADALQKLATSQEAAPIQRVPAAETETETEPLQRVSLAPPVTTSTNPTARATLQASLRTHLCTTRNNTPGTFPLITVQEQPTRKSPRLNPSHYSLVMAPVIATAPNSERMPYFNCSHLISQEAVNLLTEKVYFGEPGNHWTPQIFINASPKTRNENLDVDVEHFCATVIHPITGETTNKYQKLVKDPVTHDI